MCEIPNKNNNILVVFNAKGWYDIKHMTKKQ